jgi:hypothetical protein
VRISRFLPGHGRPGGEGVEAQAVVVASEVVPGSRGIWGCKLTLRVHFEDGTTSEFSTTKRTIDLGGGVVTEGDILPVRYEPSDRSQIELDVDAIKAQAAAAESAQKEAAIARAEAQLAGTPPPAGPSGSVTSFEQSANSFAASAREFLESALAERAAKERASNGGNPPTETLASLSQDHASGLIDDSTYEELRAKLSSGEL